MKSLPTIAFDYIKTDFFDHVSVCLKVLKFADFCCVYRFFTATNQCKQQKEKTLYHDFQKTGRYSFLRFSVV